MSWVTIHQGPTWEVDLLRGALEENGIPAFAPDANLKTLDPFITGPLSFDRSLQVPEELAGEATALIAELRERAPAREPLPADEPSRTGRAAPSATSEELARLEGIGRRLCWASLFPPTAPFVLVFAWQYFRGRKRVAARPRNHALVVAATWLCIPQILVLAGYGWWVGASS